MEKYPLKYASEHLSAAIVQVITVRIPFLGIAGQQAEVF